MVSKEFIYSELKAGHIIAVHMKTEERIDKLSSLIYVIHELVLNEAEEELLLYNISNNFNTQGFLSIKAKRSSEVDINLIDTELNEYLINTNNIVKYEQLGF